MAGNYQVRVDLGNVLAANQAIANALFPMVSKAVGAVAQHGAFQWKEAVSFARLWQVEKKAYIDSIQWQMVGPYAAQIRSDYNLAEQIESGRPARDLKRMLQTSQKTRMIQHGKNAGQKYLIIPFQHQIPTASGEGAHGQQMPMDIYKLAKDLQPSFLLPKGSKSPATRLSASGHTVPQYSYSWGGSLPEGLAPKLKDHHATDIYAGMVRFDTSTPKAKNSKYLTFRIMREGSPGWLVAAKPGLNLAKTVSSGLQDTLEKAVGGAVTLAALKL